MDLTIMPHDFIVTGDMEYAVDFGSGHKCQFAGDRANMLNNLIRPIKFCSDFLNPFSLINVLL